MAAGVGSRLGDRLNSQPKGFLIIGKQPLIERSINLLLNNGIERILIGTGYRSESYEELQESYSHVRCIRNNSYETTGSFFTLITMEPYIKEDFLLLESDLLYEEEAIKSLQNDNRKDIILASGWTGSGDEVYIEADEKKNFFRMSKKRQDLGTLYGELVGISKISYPTFRALYQWSKHHPRLAQGADYEYALSCISQNVSIAIKKIDSLLWAEIDNACHLERAEKTIFPRIEEKENG